MRILASLILRKLKDVEKIEKYVKMLHPNKIELDISKMVMSEDFERFIPLLAVELEDLLSDRVEYIRVSKTLEKNIIERLLNLIDYLNVEKLILDHVDELEKMVSIVDEASLYGVKVIWRVRKDLTPEEAAEIANELTPHKLRICIDVSSKRSIRDFVRQVLGLGGYIEVIYLDNKSTEMRGLPIFCTEGRINYVKVFKILRCVGYERDLVLKYRSSYYDSYMRDIQLAESIISSVGSQVVDNRTKRLVESVLREMMNL
ncbi:MAG: hypothetical protein GXO10_03080 [Crenarchaeota archaeon]|nr:hypothetical protein [Thermoproteota archaeon]